MAPIRGYADLIDRGVLFVICFASVADSVRVEMMLSAIIASGLLCYLQRDQLRLAVICSFFIFATFFPGAGAFLPLILFDCLSRRFAPIVLLSLLFPLASLWQVKGAMHLLMTSALSLAAILLSLRAASLARLRTEYYELRDTTKELTRQLMQQNRDLLTRQDTEITVATLAERNRIARDIHDSVGHLLSSALLQVGALLAINRETAFGEPIAALKNTLSQAMDSIRNSVHHLYDQSINLQDQMNELTMTFNYCALDFDYTVRHVPERKLKEAILAISKEALVNIARHSNATHARLSLREQPAFYQLIIADNGIVTHFDPDNGIGLKNISNRVARFHGQFNIQLKNGFELFITVPKETQK
ncbi:histidine kinase [Sporolactobacillus spathodeae]|uniref:histidine kinase n=1 Tax=Sporolactobacillus spathodeae TaxID=1465502 RepID=A0ABS2Q5S0_9BACL|nr:signal transduction histidine kinase [Sporolactobacillus spathodeae]